MRRPWALETTDIVNLLALSINPQTIATFSRLGIAPSRESAVFCWRSIGVVGDRVPIDRVHAWDHRHAWRVSRFESQFGCA